MNKELNGWRKLVCIAGVSAMALGILPQNPAFAQEGIPNGPVSGPVDVASGEDIPTPLWHYDHLSEVTVNGADFTCVQRVWTDEIPFDGFVTMDSTVFPPAPINSRPNNNTWESWTGDPNFNSRIAAVQLPLPDSPDNAVLNQDPVTAGYDFWVAKDDLDNKGDRFIGTTFLPRADSWDWGKYFDTQDAWLHVTRPLTYQDNTALAFKLFGGKHPDSMFSDILYLDDITMWACWNMAPAQALPNTNLQTPTPGQLVQHVPIQPTIGPYRVSLPLIGGCTPSGITRDGSSVVCSPAVPTCPFGPWVTVYDTIGPTGPIGPGVQVCDTSRNPNDPTVLLATTLEATGGTPVSLIAASALGLTYLALQASEFMPPLPDVQLFPSDGSALKAPTRLLAEEWALLWQSTPTGVRMPTGGVSRMALLGEDDPLFGMKWYNEQPYSVFDPVTLVFNPTIGLIQHPKAIGLAQFALDNNHVGSYSAFPKDSGIDFSGLQTLDRDDGIISMDFLTAGRIPLVLPNGKTSADFTPQEQQEIWDFLSPLAQSGDHFITELKRGPLQAKTGLYWPRAVPGASVPDRHFLLHGEGTAEAAWKTVIILALQEKLAAGGKPTKCWRYTPEDPALGDTIFVVDTALQIFEVLSGGAKKLIQTGAVILYKEALSGQVIDGSPTAWPLNGPKMLTPDLKPATIRPGQIPYLRPTTCPSAETPTRPGLGKWTGNAPRMNIRLSPDSFKYNPAILAYLMQYVLTQKTVQPLADEQYFPIDAGSFGEAAQNVLSPENYNLFPR